MTSELSAACVLAFDDETAFAARLAAALEIPLHVVDRHRFPDGEVKLRLPSALPPRVILLRGLHHPNEKLVELLLAAPGARELGAREVTLVAPYLAYMRQDMAFAPGEVVSQRHVGALLAQAFDAVITVDPHLHRVRSIDDVVPQRRGVALSAAPLLGAWIAQQVAAPVIVGPDEESDQWVREAARGHGLEAASGRKLRRGDCDVSVMLPDVDVQGRAVVLMDDVASTGHTLAAAASQLRERGAASIDVAVTHALFVGDAIERLHQAGVLRVWSTDAVPHETNRVSVVPLLATALRRDR